MLMTARIPFALATLLLLAIPRTAYAQCEGCVPDLGCTASPAFPTLCPATAPDATAGLYYEVDLDVYKRQDHHQRQ